MQNIILGKIEKYDLFGQVIHKEVCKLRYPEKGWDFNCVAWNFKIITFSQEDRKQ